jgi:hypothetical protein
MPRGDESRRHEYSEVLLTFRHYSALRFVVLTVFLAIVGVLASVVSGVTAVKPPALHLWAKIAGLLVSLAFFMLEFLIERYINYVADRAKALDEELGYWHFRGRPASKMFKTRHATWPMFGFIILFWVSSLLFFS